MFDKKKICDSKKNPKKSFSQKNKLITEHKFEKSCEAKKMHKGHITERRKNFKHKKSKLKAWHSYRKKYLKSHFRDPISYFEKCFYMQSLPTANFSLVWPNFCTPYYVVSFSAWVTKWANRVRRFHDLVDNIDISVLAYCAVFTDFLKYLPKNMALLAQKLWRFFLSKSVSGYFKTKKTRKKSS